MLSHGIPNEASLKQYVAKVYQQATSACVPFSIAAMMSTLRNIDRREWISLDAADCYYQLGGSDSSGIGARETLQYFQKKGMADRNGKRRFRIGTYAWAQARRDEGISAIKASIAAHLPCVVALFMPKDYQTTKTGTCDSTDVDLRSYHQVCVVGYDKDRFYFVDSRGPQWGAAGFGSFLIDALKASQQKYFAYACTAIDVIDESVEKLEWNWRNP
jgi:hypothetical protein